MRKVVVSEFISIDGVIEGPGPDDAFELAGWTVDYSNDEVMKFKFDELMASDILLLGGKTYEGFAAAWPGRTDGAGFADVMNKMPKYVVSTSVDNPEWNNTQVISDNAPEKISELKQQDGGDILVNGSGSLVNLLLQHNLIDEIRLLVYPVVLGTGKQLFEGATMTKLKLVDTKTFDTGVVLLTYNAS